MGAAIELLSGNQNAVGPADVTPTTGDSFTVRHTAEDTKIQLLNVWVDAAAGSTGHLNIRSPLLHDNVEGIRLLFLAQEVDPLLPWDKNQPLHSQDTLVLNSTLALAGNTNVGVLIHYEDLPGVDANFLSPDEVKDRLVNIVTVENSSLATGQTTYGTAEALTNDFNLLKSSSQYAILGYHVQVLGCCIGWRSSSWGNLRVGGPANPDDKQITANWFETLSELTGKPLIPFFYGSDAAKVFVDGVSDASASIPVTTILAELAPGA